MKNTSPLIGWMKTVRNLNKNRKKSFWKSRFGISLIISLGIAALLLGFEHRVHIFAGNGFLVFLLLGCVVMHLFMHGGHGRHGGGDKS
ncbi:DUF2933 domain-containing protein [Sulfitobacter sp. MF3-043]|uniref:DUF2933 domain-containing protein n=1 Tax=Sulfitobacter sediminivivens TaxID=3252902 RepID=UPI0036D7AF02